MIAGAGSGKTTSLIKALKYIDGTFGKELRVQNRRVACITYTTGAESEIREDVGDDNLFHVSTIHSFLWELIRPFQADIKKWVISKIDKKREKLEEEKLAFTSRTRASTIEKMEANLIKNQHIKENLQSVPYFKYETGSSYLKGILGHDDIMKMGPELITQNPLLQSIIAEKYPYFFIDESQDTDKEFILSLKIVDQNFSTKFCLGFFGDPMQKIYMTGAGTITHEPDWNVIKKPENFRCPTTVLNVINSIRSKGDELQQTGGKKQEIDGQLSPVLGSATLFILKADDTREKKLTQVRQHLADVLKDDQWIASCIPPAVKVLVLEHRMAAKRLLFNELYSSFKDGTSESISTNFSEGTSWILMPFQKYILPLIVAFEGKKDFEVMQLLRRHSPLFAREYLKSNPDKISEIFQSTKADISALATLMTSGSGSTVADVLNFVQDKQLLDLDPRISNTLNPVKVTTSDDEAAEVGMIADAINVNEDPEEVISYETAIINYLKCPAAQTWGYQSYINDESPYSTQHSVKGAEFDRVLVILDDEEGRAYTLYSYEKLLGIKELSNRDTENIAAGNDSTLDRTRRLFYVSCSRALKDLAVVLFVDDPSQAAIKLQEADVFDTDSIKLDEDIETGIN